MVTRFEVLLEIKSKDGQSVSFKQDGQRFPESTTVKLCTDTAYKLYLRLRPAHKLEVWHIGDEPLMFQEEIPDCKKDTDMAAYSASWISNGRQVTKDGQRDKLQLHFQLEDNLVLDTSVQTKFYSPSKHAASQWGQPMHILDLSCDARQGDTCVRVRRGSIL